MDIQLVAAAKAPDAQKPSIPLPRREKSPPLWHPRLFREVASSLNVHQAATDELSDAHALAETLVQTRMAPLSVLRAADAQTRGSAWLYRQSPDSAASGVLLTLPLSAQGEIAMLLGRFNAASPDAKHLCEPGDLLSAMYIWFAGGRGLRARGAVVKTALAWRDGAYSAVRAYSRAATLEGKRGLAAHGFTRIEHLGLMLCDQRN